MTVAIFWSRSSSLQSFWFPTGPSSAILMNQSYIDFFASTPRVSWMSVQVRWAGEWIGSLPPCWS